jgi:hypothetical protein
LPILAKNNKKVKYSERAEQNIIKCKAKLYETYELLSKRILHKLYTPIQGTTKHSTKIKRYWDGEVKREVNNSLHEL